MRKTKQLASLLLVTSFIVAGCAGRNNSLNYEPDTTGKHTENETDDLPVVDPDTSYNYDFSIYEDGRTFTADEISEQSEFEDYLNTIFKDILSENFVTLHFTLSEPENYGLGDVETSWGKLDYKNLDEEIEEYENLLSSLHDFSYDSLTYEQQLIYDMLDEDLTNSKNGYEYYFFESAFSPMSGFHSELPVIFSDFEFKSAEDFDDYIYLLDTVDDYVKNLCEYEEYRFSKGYSLTSYSLETVINDCNTFIDTKPNCLRPIFEEDLLEFGFGEDDINTYMEKFDSAIENSLKPAYSMIVETLTDILESDKTNELGLSHSKKGKEYYEYCLNSTVGVDYTPDEVYKMLEESMEDAISDMTVLYSKNMSIFEDYENFKYSTDDPKEMLDILIKALEKDFPKAVTDKYNLYYIPESLESTFANTLAFYLIPPIDDIDRNIIYINGEYSSDDLFSTIAHEGFPGHMYQTTYFYNTSPHYFRSLFSYGGYSEGWAKYIEWNYSYRYAGMPDDVADFALCNGTSSFAIYCLIDIGINYYGWTLDETHDFISTYFEIPKEETESIFYMMIDDPCVYMQYYLGYLEMMELKDAAKDTLGAGFDEKEFHKFILEIGPCSFSIIENRLNKWMDRVVSG